MMEREVHMKPDELLASLQYKQGDFGDIAFISGQQHRAKMCLESLIDPVRNFTFLGYTFWTGYYKGKKVTIGNGGFYAPDTALATELLCAAGVQTLVRLGSCGALREDIAVGDFIVADSVLRGDGATRYYVDDDFTPRLDGELSKKLVSLFGGVGTVHTGGVWTTDAIFRETKEIVNSYIKKGAVAVDMVTSPFATIAQLYKRKVCVVMSVSDNLITGQLGFSDIKFFNAELTMVKTVFELIKD